MTSDAGASVASDGDEYSRGSQDVLALFGPSSVFSVLTGGPDHIIQHASPSFMAAIGATDTAVGMKLADIAPALDRQGVTARLDAIYRSSEARVTQHVSLGHATAGAQASFDLTYEPLRDDLHAVVGVQLIGVETTQLRHAQRLMVEQRVLLEQIARQTKLSDVLNGMARVIEELAPEPVLVSVLLADADGAHLRHGAAPSLPAFYNEAIDGIATGEGVGSCGTAAYRREPVIVSNIATDPFWVDFRDLATRAGLAACWSTPIVARTGALLGTFAMYYPEPRTPEDPDFALARIFTETASLAIERHHSELARVAAEDEAERARNELAQLLQVENQLRTAAEQRAQDATQLANQMRSAAVAQASVPRPEQCQLGGMEQCRAPAEIKVADSWGDSAWGCADHVEQALLNVRSVFIADEQLGGLSAYLAR